MFSSISLSGSLYPATDSAITDQSACSVSSISLVGGSGSGYTLDSVLAPYSLPYTSTYRYSSPGYLSVQRSLQIGGLPLYPYTIGPTLLPLPSPEPLRVTFKAIPLRGGAINKFSIEIREGYNNYTGPCESFTFDGNEGVLPIAKNVHSILGRSEGFKTDYSEFVGKNTVALLFTTDDFAENEVRIVLSWSGEVDLDLRASFRLHEDYECDISYTNKICGGGRLTGTSQSGSAGGEEISLAEVGAYQYLVYVKEFKSEKARTRLVEALAAVKVYVKSVAGPVVRLLEQNEYPWEVSPDEYKIWMAFCMDGARGIASLAPVQAFVSVNQFRNAKGVCRQIYGDGKVYGAEEKRKIEVDRSLQQIPKNIVSLGS